ncbi:ATP-binding cassette domain-containing protein [uncultured Sphaerochaeta sp.]|uniref:ABC transporter ATP-binding protein n=1 Tax=uncultured Sphaerochaeta sp. TaxID=886478 RepID=UPI002A0A2831|nr:ATP-binding cassette domain-containing protein [uncultured Sphaerochaeta sp.]
MVEVQNVTFSYYQKGREISLFSSLDHSFEDDKVHAIIGHSGCGKTTLLYLLAGLLKPKEGKLFFNGADLETRGGDRAIILQDYGLLPWKKVYDNISLGLRLNKTPNDQAKQRVTQIMEEVGISSLAESFPQQLSGGEKQRCAIARAMVTEPKLLLMDEPFSALDAMNRENMQELLLRIQRHHSMTCIMVTHSIEEAAYLSDSIHVLSKNAKGKSSFLQSIDNSHGKLNDYRKSPEYFDTCIRIRKLLENGGEA